MAKSKDKKKLIILLIVLAIVTIGSGIWTYNTFNSTVTPSNSFSDIQIDEVFKMKEESIENIQDFLDLDFAPGTIWDDFYNNKQFHRLKDIDIQIDTSKDVGNPNPFVAPTSTSDGVKKK